MLSSASVNMNPAFQTWIQLRTLCGASPWTYRFSQHLCFSSEVECNVLGGGEGGEKKKKTLHRLHWCLQSSITRNDSAGTVPSEIEIIKWNILGRLLTRLYIANIIYLFFLTKSIFVTYCQFLHLERQGLSLGQQAGRGRKKKVAFMKITCIN